LVVLPAIQWCNELPEDIVFEVEESSNVVSLQARMRTANGVTGEPTERPAS